MAKGALIQGILLIALILGVIYLIAPFLLGLLSFLVLGFVAFYLWKIMQYAGIARYLESKLNNLTKVNEVYIQYYSIAIYAKRDPKGVRAYVTYKGLTTVHAGSIPHIVERIMYCVRQMESDRASKRKVFW